MGPAAMLVVVSDLHLTDGSVAASLPGGAFVVFAERLRDLAFSASWRADGEYRPIEGIELLLLGDVFDFATSARWLDTDLRPWHHAASDDLAELYYAIASGIVTHNQAALQVLRGFAGDGAIRVPPGTSQGKPDFQAPGQAVPVRIHPMVGECDWPLHQEGAAYDRLRRLVARHLGMVDEPQGDGDPDQENDSPDSASRIWAHDPTENEDLRDVLSGHGVVARHGDVFDPFSFDGDRQACSLTDCFAIELFVPFCKQMELVSEDVLALTALAGVRELSAVRPWLLIPRWIEYAVRPSRARTTQGGLITERWNRLADEMLECGYLRDRKAANRRTSIDLLRQEIKLRSHTSVAMTASGNTSYDARLQDDLWLGTSLADRARDEPEIRDRAARAVVYGHTHQAESVPLYGGSRVTTSSQVYFNTGTWRRVIHRVRSSGRSPEYVLADSMRFVVFYRDGERGGRPYETWTATLGVEA